MGREGGAYFWYKTEEEERRRRRPLLSLGTPLLSGPLVKRKRRISFFSLSSPHPPSSSAVGATEMFSQSSGAGRRGSLSHTEKKRETRPDLDNVEEMFR